MKSKNRDQKSCLSVRSLLWGVIDITKRSLRLEMYLCEMGFLTFNIEEGIKAVSKLIGK